MGCSAFRVILDELKDMPLDSNIEKIDLNTNEYSAHISLIETLNSYYDRAKEIIQILEDIRSSTVDKLDKIIYETGSYFFESPDISNCIKSIFWKISCDYQGNIIKANLQFYEDEPFLEIKDRSLLSEETTYIVSLLINYIGEIYSYPNRMKYLDREIPQMVYLISNDFLDLRRSPTRNNNDYDIPDSNASFIMKNKNLLRIIMKNNEKIKKSIDVYPDLNSFLLSTIEKIKMEFLLFRKDMKYVDKINKVGTEASKNNIKEMSKIVLIAKKVLGSAINIKKQSIVNYKDIIETKEKIKEELKKNCK